MSSRKKEKKGTMLSLEITLVDRAKKLGLNMSQIMNETLRHIINTGAFQPVHTQLVLINADIERIDNEIKTYDELLENLKFRREELVTESNQLDGALSEDSTKTTEAQLYQRINDVVKANEFNAAAAWADTEDLREQLKSHGVDYTYREFKTLVSRLKTI